MPTFDQIQAYARSKYPLQIDDAGHFAFTFEFNVDGQSNRTQVIQCTKFDYAGQEWVAIGSAVCMEDELSPKVALRKNSDLPVGSLALTPGGKYVLVHSLPLEDLDPDQFDLPLLIIARLADDLEQTFTAADVH